MPSNSLDRLLLALPVSVLEVDRHGRVLATNFSESLPVGSLLSDQVGAAEHASFMAALGQVFRAQEPQSVVLDVAQIRFTARLTRGCVERGLETAWVVLEAQGGGAEPGLGNAEHPEHESQLLDVAVQATGMGLWRWDLPSNQVDWDERMYAITGSSRPLTLLEWAGQLAHPDERERLLQAERALGQAGSIPPRISKIIRPDGEVRWVLVAGKILEHPSGTPQTVVGGVIDVTEQQLMTEQLKRSQKLEAMGQLTAGVAHNFNNMLMIILPCLEELSELEEAAFPQVEEALTAARRSGEIVAQLMALGGKQTSQKRKVNGASDLCQSTLRLCKRSLPQNVRLQVGLSSTAAVEMVPGALAQVLSNLIFNARDAVVDADVALPKITVTTRDTSRFGEEWFELLVTDNGPGVAASLRPSLFQPFVTTKPGRGTGLGLASSQALVQQHGGQLAYRPSPDGGAQFLVLLPTVARAERSLAPSSKAPRARRQATVLVVDDEAGIRRLLKRGLEREGFQIITCANGEEALQAATDAPHCRFVLLDRSLGGESGGALVAPLRELLNHAKVYYFTGERIGSEEQQEVDGVVHKPARVRALAELIGQALA